MAEPLNWYDDKADNPPWIKALAELRQRATREGYCYQHVQAITVAIDQYAEKALGNPRLLSQQAVRLRIAVSISSRKMPDRKFDLTVGKLSPFLNDGQEAAVRRLADNFSSFAASGVERQRKDFQRLTVRHPVC
jgi:hypothetical protein